jgi:citrate lyase subunit beta-like protein
MELAHSNARGAVGLEGEMIDAPMIKQAEKILRIARSAGIDIPKIS